ncbi:MAG TPA: ATP-binding protein [Vicinamibacterales bacterium]|nr:ATP-binding protein [Vicinamibacterales bacterium]
MASAVSTKGAQRNVEAAVLVLAVAAGLPSTIALFYLLATQPFTFEVRWTLVAVVLVTWIASAAAARQMVSRTLLLAASLLGALREGDYSIRGAPGRPKSAVDLVMAEINALGDTLQRQRGEAVESTALLNGVMAAIDVAVFAFDMDERLVLVNAAGERLVGASATRLIGCSASELRLSSYLTGDPRQLIDRPFGPESGRVELRRSTFRRDGRPHQLLVFADLSRALREEEQQAWQRIVRVLSHEINNSLTPIKSIAHSIRRMIARAGDVPRSAEIQDALALIETRSGALGRFLRAYAQLARLPKPQLRQVELRPLVRRVVELEDRLPVAVSESDDLWIAADPDQIEQLLINVIRNGVDATLPGGGAVSVAWTRGDGTVELRIEDEGPGLPDTTNLFVPFFTTKPAGSGIGLALSRQIAEAHGGTLTLTNRAAHRGCVATLRLPA